MTDFQALETRHATPVDYESVEALWLELNRHHVRAEPELIKPVDTYLSRDDYNAVVQDPKQAILLLIGESDVVGAAWLVERMHEGGQAIEMPVVFVQEFCTQESRRGLGYGRQLMSSVEKWARERNLARIEFNVWAGNSSAISFYERLGFGYARYEMFKVLK